MIDGACDTDEEGQVFDHRLGVMCAQELYEGLVLSTCLAEFVVGVGIPTYFDLYNPIC